MDGDGAIAAQATDRCSGRHTTWPATHGNTHAFAFAISVGGIVAVKPGRMLTQTLQTLIKADVWPGRTTAHGITSLNGILYA